MYSYHWIKLYHEILDDPKMCRLSDRLYRRTVELFLIAGEFDRDGLLPTVEDIAWRLRLSVEEFEKDLAELAAVNLVHITESGWCVTQFKKRQERMSDAERQQRYRDRKQQSLYYGDAGRYDDVTKRNTDKIREDKIIVDIREDEDKNATAAVVLSHYENNIGDITQTTAKRLGELIDNYPRDWIIEAIDIACENNVRKLSYFTSILKRWREDGKDNGRGKNRSGKRDNPSDLKRYSEWET